MNKNFLIKISITLCLFLINIIGFVSAQNIGVPLTTNDQLPFYHHEGNYYQFKYNNLKGNSLDAVNKHMEKSRLTQKEYSDLNIAKSKHPSLRSTPFSQISGGSTIVKTEVGMVRLIYASKRRDNNYSEIYVYLFSMTLDGKYIDSLFSGEKLYLDLSDIDELRPNEEGMYVHNNKIILVRGDGEGGEAEMPYILTSELKFKKL